MLLICDLDMAMFDECSAERDRNGRWICPLCGYPLRDGEGGLLGPEDMFIPYADIRRCL